jgi:hypothetical protein
VYRVEIVPMHLRLPYVQIWNVLHFDPSGSTPLALYSWPHETSPEALARNTRGLQILREIGKKAMPIVQSHAEHHGLRIDWSNPAATVSKLAVITQTPREFDFPIPNLPPQFHYAGPLHDNEGREPVPFPWKKLTGQPLIYASLGTLVNGLTNVYGKILEAVNEFPGHASRSFGRKEREPGRSGANSIEHNRRPRRSTARTIKAGSSLHNPCGAKYGSGSVGPGSTDGSDPDWV